MRRFSTAAATLALLATFIAHGHARDIFVNNVTGDDRNDGVVAANEGVRRGPLRTIACATRIAEAGDRIVLAKTEQPYRESITLQGGRNSGLSLQPFILDGNGATLEGATPVPQGAWQFVSGNVFRFQPRRLHHQNVFLGGVPAVRRDAKNDEPLPELKPLEWCMWRQAIYFCVEDNETPRTYDISFAAHTVGITLYEVHNVIVTNLIVQGFQIDGVNAHDGARDCSLITLVCRGNGRSGISIGGASRVDINECTLGNNVVTQLRVEGRAIARAQNSKLLETGVPTYQLDGGRLSIDGQAAQ
jgi:hypothetical protein